MGSSQPREFIFYSVDCLWEEFFLWEYFEKIIEKRKTSGITCEKLGLMLPVFHALSIT